MAAALEGQGVLPEQMQEAIQWAADLLEEMGWAVMPTAASIPALTPAT